MSGAVQKKRANDQTKHWNKSVESFWMEPGGDFLSLSLTSSLRPKECFRELKSQFLKRPRFAPSREIDFFAAAAAADACVSQQPSQKFVKCEEKQREKSPTGMCWSVGWYWWMDNKGSETISRCLRLEQDFVGSEKLSAEMANSSIVICMAFPKRKFLDRCRHGRD